MQLPHSQLGQRNRKWGSVKLGTSSTTISGYGCTITSIANALGLDSPVIVNDALNSVNGYADGNLVIWDLLPKALPRILEVERVRGWKNGTEGVIKTMLDKGEYALIEVNGAPIGGVRHWLLAYGYDTNLFLYDPWFSETSIDDKWIPTGYTRLKIKPIELPINNNNMDTKFKKAWNLIAKRMDLSSEEAIGQQAVDKYNESEKDRENKSEIIKNKESVIAKQSELLIVREETIKSMTETLINLEKKANVDLALLNACNLNALEFESKNRQLEENYKVSQDICARLRKERDILAQDKHLPRGKILRKIVDFLIALDNAGGGETK